MKRMIIFWFVIFLLIGTIPYYAQQRDNYSKSVLDFIDILYDQSIFEETAYGLKYTFNRELSEDILQKYYKVKAEDPIGLFNYITEEYEVIINRTIASGKNSTEKRTPFRKRELKEELSKIYGENFMEIIDVPYFLRIKVIQKSKSIYVSPGPPESKYGTFEMKVLIEDVLKGEIQFTKGSIISIEYLSQWLGESSKQFQVDKSYFIPLRPWMGTKGFLGWTLNFLPDNNFAIYEIENEVVKTPENYFDIETETNWADFKKLFTKKYILF